ncbi:helix-turn-helix domain-containing protein [Rhizobium leguminosarum]|uniref:helix-turn-helix domain-containing protein n=1 Tax=Rhizobium leguminosarum TaxID=384 RepID=UPI00103CB89A|nr:AraC family transcriptional regulator [Rhizobium leguminosarum]TBY27445.1 AraC family transcriptional regulator [Rhizobium leguminosarum bv. viciae]
MNDLLQFAVDAHGGLDRWNSFSNLSVDVQVGGIWAYKGQGSLFSRHVFEIETHRQHLRIWPFTGSDRTSDFRPDLLQVVTEAGETIEARPDPEASFKGMAHDTPWDPLHMPRPSLEETAREMGVRGSVRLKQPYLGFVDPMFTHISGMLVTMFANPEHAPALAVDHLGIAIQAHILKNYGEGVFGEPKKSGGLAGWQERRSKELIESELGTVSLAQLAEECGISVGHFVRAFKKTTGVPPYQWLTARRIEKVSCLLTESDEPLPVVAELCGFADQSHMGRAFLKHHGATPSAWRRRHRDPSI